MNAQLARVADSALRHLACWQSERSRSRRHVLDAGSGRVSSLQLMRSANLEARRSCKRGGGDGGDGVVQWQGGLAVPGVLGAVLGT
eukprot:15471828-Alexandrium_andersonii.AAC.1